MAKEESALPDWCDYVCDCCGRPTKGTGCYDLDDNWYDRCEGCMGCRDLHEEFSEQGIDNAE
jgi:hypothetical protein